MTVKQLVERLMNQCGPDTEVWMVEVGEGEAEQTFLPVNVYLDNIVGRAVVVVESL